MNTTTAAPIKTVGGKHAERAALKLMFEELGQTPHAIIENLFEKKCKFGVVSQGKGCIMQQFFRQNKLDVDFLFGTLNQVKPRNAKAIREVIAINDVVKP